MLAVVNDTSDIESRLSRSMRDLLVHAAVQILVTVPLALFLVRWTFTDPLARLALWLRRLHAGQPENQAALPRTGVFDELSHVVAHLARDLGTARQMRDDMTELVEHACSWERRLVFRLTGMQSAQPQGQSSEGIGKGPS